MTSDDMVREYQLQMLLRIKMLYSGFALSVEESIKQKFVRQFALLLDNIQRRMEGAFFGDWSLYLCGKTVESRYSHTWRYCP